MTTFPTGRSYAEDCDAADPPTGFRECFALDDPSLIYLDGNSLGMLPPATAERIATVVRQEGGTGLIRSWSRWIDLPRRAGDFLGQHLLGAAPGQVLVRDSTTVNCTSRPDRPGRLPRRAGHRDGRRHHPVRRRLGRHPADR